MHYMAYVFVNGANTTPSEIKWLLAPYTTDRTVARHRATCRCVGRDALQESEKMAANSVIDLTDETRNLLCGKDIVEFLAAFQELGDTKVDLASQFFQDHPGRNLPDPKCLDCQGSGKIETNSNPEGYYSGYTVGGRWKHMFPNRPRFIYVKRIRNYLESYLLMQQVVEKCGYSRALRYKVLEDMIDPTPFAAVTPDGIWHQRNVDFNNDQWLYTKSGLQAWRLQFLELCNTMNPTRVAIICDMVV